MKKYFAHNITAWLFILLAWVSQEKDLYLISMIFSGFSLVEVLSENETKKRNRK